MSHRQGRSPPFQMGRSVLSVAFFIRGKMGMHRSQVNTVSTSAKCSESFPGFSRADAFSSSVKRMSTILETLPGGFAETLECHLKRCHITTNQLSELTNLSIATITRYRTDNETHRKLSAVVLICLALKLNPVLSLDLVKKAGFSFTCSTKHTAYQMLLMLSPVPPIEQCNEFLIFLGLDPLNKS